MIIANKLESTGLPGHIHISETTRRHLSDEFVILPGPPEAQENSFLKKYKIKTYLIPAIDVPEELISADLHELVSQYSFKSETIHSEVIRDALRIEFESMPVGVIS